MSWGIFTTIPLGQWNATERLSVEEHITLSNALKHSKHILYLLTSCVWPVSSCVRTLGSLSSEKEMTNVFQVQDCKVKTLYRYLVKYCVKSVKYLVHWKATMITKSSSSGVHCTFPNSLLKSHEHVKNVDTSFRGMICRQIIYITVYYDSHNIVI